MQMPIILPCGAEGPAHGQAAWADDPMWLYQALDTGPLIEMYYTLQSSLPRSQNDAYNKEQDGQEYTAKKQGDGENEQRYIATDGAPQFLMSHREMR